MKTFTEYQVQYRFSPRGCWHSDGTTTDDKEDAERIMKLREESERLSPIKEKFFGDPKYWRVAKRQVMAWEDA